MTDPDPREAWPHPTRHLYTSTYCQHAQHSDCRLTCKVCSAPCLCPCHRGRADD